MSWLGPNRWIERAGPAGRALRSPYAPRRADRALASLMIEDPRRLVVVTGPAGAGASRLVLELARRFPVVAYRDPLMPPDPVHEVDVLEHKLSQVAAVETPLVILDGPDAREALSPLRELLARRIHPRLRVIVPCRVEVARRLGAFAGGYPRRSMLVAELARTRSEPPWVPRLGAALTVLAAAGRVPVALLPSAAALVDAGVAAFAPGGELVCLLDERNRGDLLIEQLIDSHAGRVPLAQAIAACPSLRPRVLETLLWFGDGSLGSVILPLTALTPEQLLDLDAARGRGAQPPPTVLAALALRGDALRAAGGPDEVMAGVEERMAMLARQRGDRRAQLGYLTAALARTIAPRRRARLASTRAAIVGDLDAARRASALARVHADAAGLIAALRTEADILARRGQRLDARQRLVEVAVLEDGIGHVGAGAATRLIAAELAQADGAVATAIELAAAAAAASQVVGNARLQTRALCRLARLYALEGDVVAATAVLVGALALCETARDLEGAGDCHRALATLAAQRGASAAEASHLRAAMDAFTRAGRLPPAPLAGAAMEAEVAAIETEGEALAAMSSLPLTGTALRVFDRASPRPSLAVGDALGVSG